MTPNPLLDPLEIGKLVDELIEDVIQKRRPIPGTDRFDRSGFYWWRDSGFQDQIHDEAIAKITDWLEFRLART